MGGEDNTVNSQIDLFKKKGYKVYLYDRYNDNINSIIDYLLIFVTSFFNLKAFFEVYNLIKREKIKIVFVHNIFPILSPSVILAAKLSGAKVYLYLHNFRWLCCGDKLYRDDKICEECPKTNSIIPGIKNKCYKNFFLSLWKTIAVNIWKGSVKTLTDFFICPSQTVREIYSNYGFEQNKLVFLSHFVEQGKNLEMQKNISACNKFLFIGRLEKPKGVLTLLDAFKNNNYSLEIIGDGPLKNEIVRACGKYTNIKYLGVLQPDETYKKIAEAGFLIQPSEWYETFARTIAEAYSQVTPVIGSRLGTRKELVIEGKTGFLFEPGNADELNRVIDTALKADYAELSANCFKRYNEFYSEEVFYKNLAKIIPELL